jgi:hypothetical protein
MPVPNPGKKKGGKRGGRSKATKRKGKAGDDERDPKKPKLEGRDGGRETETRQPNPDSNRDRTPKRKIVLLFGYCGKNYIGLQRLVTLSPPLSLFPLLPLLPILPLLPLPLSLSPCSCTPSPNLFLGTRDASP